MLPCTQGPHALPILFITLTKCKGEVLGGRGVERKGTILATPTVPYNFPLQPFHLVGLESIQLALFKTCFAS